ncbi:MAG TPA: glycosyltransferase [Ktedonobacterales bacterium]|nr:glycosyltransferase [Ktedonobacterales bacterium]
MPTHGRRASLLRVLRALARQTAPANTFEVVVICDGDVDSSVAACRELAPELPYPLRVLEQANQGPAAARNRGVVAATAPLIIFLDDDVVPAPELIATHLAAQAGQERRVTLGPLLPPADMRLNAWGEWEERTLLRQYAAMEAGQWQPTYRQFYTGNASARKGQLIAAGGFDPRYRRAEDVELALRLADAGAEYVFLPRARGWHYVHRTFAAWLKMPDAYGRADAAMAAAGRPELLTIIAQEFPTRNRLVRQLVWVCVGRPRLMAPLMTALGCLTQAASLLRLRPPGRALCSLDFNLRYYAGLAAALGGRAAFQRLLRGEPSPVAAAGRASGPR